MKFACSMGLSAMADRMVSPPSLSCDGRWPHATKCTHSLVVDLRLEGNLVYILALIRCLCPSGMNELCVSLSFVSVCQSSSKSDHFCVIITSYRFLANVNSCSCSLYVVVRPSIVCLSSICLSSVTFVHPTQPIEIFGNVSAPCNTLVTWRHPGKILRRSSQGNPSVGGLNQRVLEKM